MAHLTRLRLSHFRSHRRTEVEADARPVALFGANGAGKTNVLEAISLLSPGRGLRRATVEEFARRPEALGWRVAADLHTGRTVELVTGAEPGQPRTVTIDGKTAPQVALGRVVRMLWLVPAMDRLWTEAAEGRRRFLDRMTMSFAPDHAEAVLRYERAMRDRNRLLKDQVHDPAWFGALEAQMASAGAEIQRNRLAAIARLARAQSDAETSFPAASLSLRGPEGAEPVAEAETLAEALRDGRARDMLAGRTLTGPHRADLHAVYTAKRVAARDASTGEQKALLLSLVLANARALAADTGAPPILLLDEVAAHLDASRRSALYDEICALGAQAWLTGTGRELFEELEGRARIFEVTDSDGSSTVAPADF